MKNLVAVKKTEILIPKEIIIENKIIKLDEKKVDIIKSALLGVSGALAIHVSKIVDIMVSNKFIIPAIESIKGAIEYLNAPLLAGFGITITNFQGFALGAAWLIAATLNNTQTENAKREKAGKQKIEGMMEKYPGFTNGLLIVLATLLIICFA